MTRTVVQRAPETAAVLAAARTSGVPVGDSRRPDESGWPGGDSGAGDAEFTPYAVLYPGVVIEMDGPVSDPWADTGIEYQFTSIGVTREQAEMVADRVRSAVLTGPLVVPGRCVRLVEPGMSAPATPDLDTAPPLFFAVDIVTVWSTPE